MKRIVKIQIALAVSLLIAGGFFAYFIFNQIYGGLEEVSVDEQVSVDEVFYKVIDGTIASKENKNLMPIAIMIENHIDSRPQFGLSKASVVYEVLTEATITRFLAIYDLSENIEKIGPVRSARSYFVDLAGEYGALYVHCGGSPEAVSRLKYDNFVINLDEFFGYNSGYFYRDNNKYAPHNLFTSSDLLSEAKLHYQLNEDINLATWNFKDGLSEGDQPKEIKINYSQTSSHQVAWKYDPNINKYERWQNNSRHVDNDGTIIEADNVIIQFANTYIVDEVGRKRIDLIGEGRLVVFRDGVVIEGNWKREDAYSRTFFYDFEGDEIELNRGKIWIQVVPTDMEIEY